MSRDFQPVTTYVFLTLEHLEQWNVCFRWVICNQGIVFVYCSSWFWSLLTCWLPQFQKENIKNQQSSGDFFGKANIKVVITACLIGSNFLQLARGQKERKILSYQTFWDSAEKNFKLGNWETKKVPKKFPFLLIFYKLNYPIKLRKVCLLYYLNKKSLRPGRKFFLLP